MMRDLPPVVLAALPLLWGLDAAHPGIPLGCTIAYVAAVAWARLWWQAAELRQLEGRLSWAQDQISELKARLGPDRSYE